MEPRLQLMGEIARQRLASQKCAADAANYVHPKLAAISHANDADPPADHFRRRTGERSARAARQRRDRPALSIGHRTSRGGRNARPVTVENLDESKFTAYPAGTFYSEPPS
jgi:hypothetical protein